MNIEICFCEICRADFSVRVWKRIHEAGYRNFTDLRADIAQDCHVLLKLPGFGATSWAEFVKEDASVRRHGLKYTWAMEQALRAQKKRELFPSVRKIVSAYLEENKNVNPTPLD